MSADWTSEYLTMIEDCEKRDTMLSEWERNFIDSIRSQIEDDRKPSARQVEVLDNIWEKATRKG